MLIGRHKRSHRRLQNCEQIELLEVKTLLSGSTGGPPTETPTAPGDDGSDLVTPPENVTGTFSLTNLRYGDSRPMSFDDVFQRAQDSCVFASALSATALTSFSLESGIREISRSGSTITYGVRLYQNNAGTFSPIERQVVFDGTTTTEDYKPRNYKDYWPLIYQRAYIAYANSLPNQSYKSSVFSFQTLNGVSATHESLSNSLATAQAIRAALTSGQGTLAGTIDSSNLLLENRYGLIKNHAYTVLGVSIPASGSLTDTKVTLRNPWGNDTDWTYYDSDHNNVLSDAEYIRNLKGIDGANDGIISLPWNVFSTYFEVWTHTNRTGTNINNIVRVDLPVQFTQASLPAYQIYEGQRLEIPIRATDPEGRFVYYEIVRGSGYVNPQSGNFSWEPPANSSGYHFITVSAETNPGDAQTLVFLVAVRSGSPVVRSFTASPATIKDDGSDLLTLTATATTDIGRINDIQYWRDADGDGSLDKTRDVFLGDSGRFYVSGLTPGSQTFFAQARRFSFSDEFFSFPRPITVNVVAAPRVAPIANPNANQVQISPAGQNWSANQVLPSMNEEWSWVLGGSTVRRIDNSGNVLNTFQVAEAGASNIRMATNYDGRLFVVWYKNSSFWGRWYSTEGNATASASLVRTGIDISDESLRIAANFWGDFVLVWHMGQYLEEDVWSLTMRNDGTIIRVPWRVSTSSSGSQKYPTVSMNRDGDGIIAWNDGTLVGTQYETQIKARSFSLNRNSYTNEFVVSTAGGTVDLPISSAVNSENSEAWVGWTVNSAVKIQKVARDGRLLGATINVNSFQGGSFSTPSIAVNSNGWVVAAWNNSVQDGNANDFGGVYAQVLTPGGVKAGPEFAIPNDKTNSQSLTGVTLDWRGRMRAFWSHSNGSSSSIKARFFTVDFPPVIPSGQSFPVAAGTAAGTVIGTVKAYENNDGQPMTWALLNSPGFAISQMGELSLTAAATFSTGPTIAVNVRVTTNGKSTDQTVTVSKSLPVALKSTLLQPMDVRQIGTDFGQVVVANETFSVVGAPNTQFNNASGRVFVYNAANTLIRTIENPEPTVAQAFGTSLAISGNRLLVQAGLSGSTTPHLYLFDLTNGALISSIHFNAVSYIGTPSISGDLIVVPNESQHNLLVYNALTGALLRTISDPTQTIFSTRFGRSAVISGNTIVAGLPGYVENGTGAARIYVFDASTGSLNRTIMQPASSSYESFGDVLAVSGDTLLVGDHYADGQSGTQVLGHSGLVHAYSLATGSLIRTINNPVPVPDDRFGLTISISSNAFVVGAYTNGSGNIHAFNLTSGSLINTYSNPAARQLYSTAIGHGQILIGGPNVSLGSANEETGAVYVFDANTKALRTTLFNNTFAAGDQLGSAVAASETRIVVGAPYNDQLGPSSGRVMIYDAKTGTVLFTLDPTLSSGTLFGNSVATYGNIVAVGAPNYRSESGDRIGGGVLIFDATTGSLLRVISNPSSTFDFFGQAIALFGDKLVVGAPYSDVGAVNAGRIYEFDVNSGTLLATINNPSPAAEENFGGVLAISESVIVAGVPNDNTSGSGSGEAYVFSVSSGLQIRTLSNPTPDTYDHFGISVTASGDLVAVGATGDSSQGIRTGQVYLYQLASSAPVRTFSNPSPLQYQNFGYSVSLSGNVLVIGNRLFDLPHGATGQAYAYDVRNGALAATLKNPTSANGDYFGHAVAISGNTIVVGAPNDDTQNTDQGAAYLYELSSRPMDLELSSETVPVRSPQDLIVGTLNSYSQALNAVQYTYQIVAGAGDTDNARFRLSGNQLILMRSASDAEKTTYNVRIRSSDDSGNTFDKSFIVKVGNHVDGTAADDAFVVTYSGTNTSGTVSVTRSAGGGSVVSLGTFLMTSPLTINGLGGTDSIRVVGTTGGDTISVNSSVGLTINGASLILNSVENRTLAGGAGGDVYRFDADTPLGAWILDEAAGGTDTVDFSPTTTVGLSLNLAAAGLQAVHSTNLSLSLSSAVTFENAIGGSGADTLTGNSLGNTLNGGPGDDRLIGAAGSDLLFGGANNDSYLFGPATVAEADQVTENLNEGIDTLNFAYLTSSVVANLGATAVQAVHANRTLKLNSAVSFENIIGGAGADALTGNSLNNTLIGGPGDDTLNGAAGSDSLYGGTNNDSYLFGPAAAAEADQVTENTNEGIDTLNFAFLTTDVVLNLGSTAVQPVHTNRTLKLNSISTFENAIGGTGSDTLLGNALSNRLTGGNGNNILVGVEAADILVSGTGRDILIGGLGLDILNGGAGDDIVIAGRTTSDNSLTSLATLRTGWISVAPYATRVANLRAGVGNPLVSLKTTINVLNDVGEDDSLAGGGDSDWFFRALDDVITDLAAGELIDVL